VQRKEKKKKKKKKHSLLSPGTALSYVIVAKKKQGSLQNIERLTLTLN
jgi:hypothetical protein